MPAYVLWEFLGKKVVLDSRALLLPMGIFKEAATTMLKKKSDEKGVGTRFEMR